MKSRTVGVIGGMGPAATVDFIRRLVAATPASCDQEHLHLLVDCNPSVPDRTAAILGNGPDPSAQLAGMAAGLEASGAELLVMPCNSAHAFAGAIKDAVSVPLVDWPGVAVQHAERQVQGPIGLLATRGTILSRIYENAFSDLRRFIAPMESVQTDTDWVIRAVKRGETRSGEVAERLLNAVAGLSREGARAVLLACTELSTILGAQPDLNLAIPCVDASDAVAVHTVALAMA
jgi:aspartate racemase